MKMDNNQALKEFLIYSYFGIVPQNLFDSKTKKERSDDSYHDYCVKRVIIQAYRDATNEGAYNTLFKKGLTDREELVANSKAARRKSAEFLLKKIKKLNTVVDFDKWHGEEVCKELVENYETVKSEKITFFTYGNAQKWVNMTIKYLWMLGLLPSNINANDLHIPIDGFIIDALWKEQDIEFPLIDEKTTTRSFAYKKPSDKVKGWSNWVDKEYEVCRKSVKGTDYTLAWENEAWIEQAEERKKKKRLEQHNVFFGENDVK